MRVFWSATVVDRGPRLVGLACVALLSASLLGLFALGQLAWAALALPVAWSLSFSPLPASLGARVFEVAPSSTDVGNAVMTVAFNLGIGGGALVGGALVAGPGVRARTLVAGLIAAAALTVLVASRAAGAGPLDRLAALGLLDRGRPSGRFRVLARLDF
jgi:predicted MFS family arabinose efflux permease